jgi:ubiquinone/menaquinone biosynthesis C-methylase UbiE
MAAIPAERLREILEDADRTTDEEWLASLSQRKKAELEFHDRVRDAAVAARDKCDGITDIHHNSKYYDTIGLSLEYRQEWIRSYAPGKIFLDYACGNGADTIAAAQAGAALAIGLDISRVSIENCRRQVTALGLTQCTYFVQGDCENTGLPSDAVDLVMCNGMLHHLDLSYAFPELRRILKAGGRIFAFEALNYNPLIRLYRNMTPAMRTEWESAHILSLKEVRFASYFFQVRDVRYWHLASILATPFRGKRVFSHVLKAANAIDRVVLRIPGIRQMSWIFTFQLVKQ